MASLDQIQGIDDSNSLIWASQQGRQNALADQQRMLAQRAGNYLANGDTDSAKNAFYRGGDINSAWKVGDRQAADDAAQNKIDIGTKYTTDPKGAVDLAYKSGDLDTATALQGHINRASDRQLADANRAHAVTSQLAATANSEPLWNTAMDTADKAGLDTRRYRAVQQQYGWEAARQLALAEHGDLGASLTAEQTRRDSNNKALAQSLLAAGDDEDKQLDVLKNYRKQGMDVSPYLIQKPSADPSENAPSYAESIAPGAYETILGKGGQGATVFNAEQKANKAKSEIDLGDTSLRGEDYLRTINQTMATQVKAIAEGRAPFPSAMERSKPYGQALISALSNYDPNFDFVNANARQKTRNDFTSGQSAKNIQSFNTAIGHAGTLDDAIDALHNGGFPAWNRLSNAWARNAGDTRFQVAEKNFAVAKNALTEELAKAFKGVGATNLEELRNWERTINEADSPAALHASVDQAITLLKSRIDAVGDSYNRGMGTTKDPMELLGPHAKAAYSRFLQRSGQLEKQAADQPQIISDRPAGLNDAQLIEKARDAIKGGKDPDFIKRQLRAWGIKAE